MKNTAAEVYLDGDGSKGILDGPSESMCSDCGGQGLTTQHYPKGKSVGERAIKLWPTGQMGYLRGLRAQYAQRVGVWATRLNITPGQTGVEAIMAQAAVDTTAIVVYLIFPHDVRVHTDY